MLSSICVAVITGTPTSTQWRMIRFCRCGTSSSGHSIPRSPRATITASASAAISSSAATAGSVSILATRWGRCGSTASRTFARSAAARTNETARKSTPSAAMIFASRRSSSVGVCRRRRSAGMWTPGRPCVVPPVRIRVTAQTASTDSTRSEMAPSPMTTRSPARRSCNKVSYSTWNCSAVLRPSPATSTNSRPATSCTPSGGSWPARTFGPGRSASTPTT